MKKPIKQPVLYGDLTEQRAYTIYIVETMWPDTSGGERKHRKGWGRYYPTAFNDRRDPKIIHDGYGRCNGTFDQKNKDVAEIAERVTRWCPYGDGLGGDFANIAAFTTASAALAYAARMREFGELSSKYDNMTHIKNWRQNHSGAIGVRVVEERMARITRVVESATGGA